MFSDDRKESVTPKFGKRNIPFGLWINSPKKHFVKLGKRWPSAGSVKSTSSESGSRSSEIVEMRPAGRSRVSRQNRVSQLFARGRWLSERKLAEPGSGPEAGADSGGPGDKEEQEELSVQPGAPGVLKIFGDQISAGANYKSVLATARSTAGSLVKEVLARYAMGQEAPSGFLLCDVVGRGDGPAGSWQTQCLRAVGDHERPLVLQEMWRPRRGYSRRFEIRRREEVDRASLRRSISEANISGGGKKDRKSVKSMLLPEPGDRAQTEASEIVSRSEELNFEEMAQTLIRPPSNLPYFLLLQGYDDKQDLVLHLMSGKKHVFGRGGRTASTGDGSGGIERVDTALCAPDILPRHCCVRRVERAGPGGGQARPEASATVRAYRGARVTRNGGLLQREAVLRPGDLLGLGEHFLLMYKDPAAGRPSPRPDWLPAPASPRALREAFSCLACGRALQDDPDAVRAYLSSRQLCLRYGPEEEDVGRLLEEVVGRMGGHGDEGGGQQEGDNFELAPAYLFAICIQYSADALEPRHLPGLLLKIANLVKKTTWDKIKEISKKQPDT
uniref:ras-interacting protein 1 n=1 Tax=Pristiophorus japonicus TaxID=55135 RepID=UPI00398F7184